MSADKGPIEFPRRIPFVEHLGFELWNLGDGTAELRLALQVHQMNSLLVAHGGVVMTMLDVTMAHAARSTARTAAALDATGIAETVDGAAGVAAKAQGVVTVEMKTSFMRASHGQLRAVATLLHRTATMAFCEGSVFDASGALCAHATGTFKYVRGLAGHATRQAEAAVALDAREEALDAIQQAAQPSPVATTPAADVPALDPQATPASPQPSAGQDASP